LTTLKLGSIRALIRKRGYLMNENKLWTADDRIKSTSNPYPKKPRRSLMDVIKGVFGHRNTIDPEVEEINRLLQKVGEHERRIQLYRGLEKLRHEEFKI
jgi:DNA-binding winged helix-turn-helix (wHTH) protein